MKRAVIFVISAVLFAMCLPVFAAQFPDVPTDHWAYAAVQDLADKGVVVGYPDGTFSGKRALTRYEFAQALSRAIPVIAKLAGGAGAPGTQGEVGPVGPAGPQGPAGVTPEQLANIQKLIDEFRDELAAQGVDIQALKKDVAALKQRVEALEVEQSRVKIKAETVLAAQGVVNNSGFAVDKDNRPLGNSANPLVDNAFFTDIQLGIDGRVSNNTTVKAIIDAGDYLPFAIGSGSFNATSFFGPNDEQFQLFNLYMQSAVNLGPLGASQVVVGRFPFQLTPLTLKFVNPDSYIYLSTLQNGDFVLDGGNVSFKLGKANLTAFAGDRVASLGIDQPALQINGVNGILIDQLAGARATMGFMKNGKLGVTYYQAGPETTNPVGGQLRVYGADLKTSIAGFGIDGEWAKSDPSDMMKNDLDLGDANNNWNANLSYKLGNLNIGGGYTDTGIDYIAPGYWDRLGRAVNLVNAKGEVANVSYAFSPKLGIYADASFLEPRNNNLIIARSSTQQGDVFASGALDKVTAWKAGIKYSLTAANAVDLGYEEAQWKGINDAGTAKERYYNIGLGHQFSSNASLKLLYQIVDYKIGGSGFDFYGDGAYRGGIATAQFHLKY